MDFSLIIPIIVSSILSLTIPIIISSILSSTIPIIVSSILSSIIPIILSSIITSTWQLCCAVIFMIYHNDSQQDTLQHLSQYISSKQKGFFIFLIYRYIFMYSPCASISSSHMAQISSMLSSAAVCGSSMAA